MAALEVGLLFQLTHGAPMHASAMLLFYQLAFTVRSALDSSCSENVSDDPADQIL